MKKKILFLILFFVLAFCVNPKAQARHHEGARYHKMPRSSHIWVTHSARNYYPSIYQRRHPSYYGMYYPGGFRTPRIYYPSYPAHYGVTFHISI